MAKNDCCVDAADLRVLYYAGPYDAPIQSIYTVPAGRQFVVNAWTIAGQYDNQYAMIARMWRSGAPVALIRIWESIRGYNETSWPTGIRFGAGESIELETPSVAVHYIYGYEIDD